MEPPKLILLSFIILVTGCQPFSQPVSRVTPLPTPAATSTVVEPQPAPVKPVPPPPAPKPIPQPPPQPSTQLPDHVDIPVAFASQAPYSNWDALHEEACEEASMAMVVKYLKKQPMSAHIMEQEILNLVKWETAQGIPVDATADEVVTILRDYYGVKSSVVDEVTTGRIKKELAAGNLIIIPAAGRLLGNPNFTGLGPIYHMLVIRGYTATDFITNDPGTRKGEGYRYTYVTLLNAIHDWQPELAKDEMTEAEMATGRKVMVVVPSVRK